MLRPFMNLIKHNVCLAALYTLLLLAFSSPSIAEKTDSEHPIKITSDTAEFDDKTGYAVHKGHVVLDQGSRHLTADTLIIKRNENNKVYLIIATGKPAHFHAQPELHKPIGYGKANTLKFYPLEDKVILIENAKLTQDKDEITGPILTYYLNKRLLESTPKDGKRTTVIIQPNGSQSKIVEKTNG